MAQSVIKQRFVGVWPLMLLIVLAGLLHPARHAFANAASTLNPATNPLGTVISPSASSVTISSTTGWQKTPLTVQQGERFTIAYTSGKWTVDTRNYPYVGPEGYSPDVYIPAGCEEVASLPYGRLLGKIGFWNSFLCWSGSYIHGRYKR